MGMDRRSISKGECRHITPFSRCTGTFQVRKGASAATKHQVQRGLPHGLDKVEGTSWMVTWKARW